MKSSSALFLTGTAFLLTMGCQPAPETQKAEGDSVQETVLTAEEQFIAGLTQTNWCVVESKGSPFEAESAVAITYLKEGYALIKSIRSERAGAAVVEDGAAAMWTYEDGLLTFRNLLTEEVTRSTASWVNYTPQVQTGSLWGYGVSATEQTCLKTETTEDPVQTEIHCPCDLHKIWKQTEN
ncbi:MAG: hypothetical protein KF789_07580 [Bdellovibrionaceae bacterium]|nr:hypothetical protein [Pseudobdellovibrionaceae bacterium]